MRICDKPLRPAVRAQPGQPGQLPRLLPTEFDGTPVSHARHLARYGPLPVTAPAGWRASGLMAEIERSGLTGRGGAGFPTARKLAAMPAGRRAVVIANGTEGEPASAKDQVLLANSPHLVLDGATVAASMAGAARAFIVVPRCVEDAVTRAVAERRRAACSDARFTVITAADGFVAGEASAVVHWIDRGVPAPTARPPRLAERGLRGVPTLVQNVETLAHLALLARYGATWFRSVGTPDEPGSMLVTVAGAVHEPSVLEIAIGTRISKVLALAGGPSRPLRALLLGGYFGTWVDATAAQRAPFSSAGLARLGAGVGAGLIAALPDDACGLAETARLADYLAGESAGQCGPCRFGLDAIAGQLQRLAEGRNADLAALNRWLGQVRGRGACSHPDGVAQLVGSALDLFANEIEQHRRGWCSGTAAVLPVPPRRQR